MHTFDPNGSLREHRRTRERIESYRLLLFFIGSACGLVLVGCAVTLTLSLMGK